MIDIGENVAHCVLGTDSSSAKEYHGETWSRMDSSSALSLLWLQELTGEHNTADIGTKAVTAPMLKKHLKTLKMKWRSLFPFTTRFLHS